ncbi:hypothetical protein QYM36_000816 [Artemia franciscana]|uniref:Protein YIPF n=1 Tax=Artemia franciscana TaxID=6661 RepID=A0AA88IDB3_ARTSF|nr:hypothetical protein QYM36_000816 [Artemia franciscana]
MDFYDPIVKGEMASLERPGIGEDGLPEFNTLDEPIKNTIMRDLGAAGQKFKYVLFPKQKQTLLKEWDLWGPFMLCTYMAMMLQKSADNSGNASESGPEFAEVFLIVCLGAIVVTLNSSLLGGKISFFQSVCVLGYCLLPCVIALTVCFVILFAEQTSFLFFLRFIVTLLGFAWAVYGKVFC